MHNPARILIVDDNEANRDILKTRLSTHGYDLREAADGEDALSLAKEWRPDLLLLDVMMPKLNGIEVCRRLRGDPLLPFTAIILVTARADSEDVVVGLEAGADEYLTKPIDQIALVARVKSMLRLKELHDRAAVQAADLASWNRKLEERVAQQVGEIERVGRLRRFLAPQIAELILSSGNDRVLESHRSEITVVFCDLRGFTAFSESAAPEDVMRVLREYQTSLGTLVDKFEGTVERFTGDGMMAHVQRPAALRGPLRPRGANGHRDARHGRGAGGQLAQVRPRSRFCDRHGARLRDARPHRLRAEV
jgi:DNA-binding response OmpR family regulator